MMLDGDWWLITVEWSCLVIDHLSLLIMIDCWQWIPVDNGSISITADKKSTPFGIVVLPAEGKDLQPRRAPAFPGYWFSQAPKNLSMGGGRHWKEISLLFASPKTNFTSHDMRWKENSWRRVRTFKFKEASLNFADSTQEGLHLWRFQGDR